MTGLFLINFSFDCIIVSVYGTIYRATVLFYIDSILLASQMIDCVSY